MARHPIDAVLTCFNEANYIAAAIDSVISQTAFHLVDRIWIVDDGSTDGSWELLERYADAYDYVALRRGPGKGNAAARNVALRESAADFVAFLDGDDLWAPDKIERQWKAITESSERCGLWYSDFVEFEDERDGFSRRVSVRHFSCSEDFIADLFVHDAPIVPSTTIVRSSVLKDVGLFDETKPLLEDLDLWLRIGERYRAARVPGFLLMKRVRQGSLSRKLETWEEAFNRVTEEWCERRPDLQPLRRRRTAVRYRKLGYEYLMSGKEVHSLRCLARSLRKYPFDSVTWGCVLMNFLPHRLRRRLVDRIRRR